MTMASGGFIMNTRYGRRMNRVIFLGRKTKYKRRILIGCALITAAAVFCIWQNNALTVSKYEYETQKVNGHFDGYVICQISDLHNKMFGKDQGRLLKRIRNEKPDLIVITGDIIDGNHTHVETALSLAASLPDIAPAYYVTGNHEYRVAPRVLDALLRGLEQSGIEILDNDAREISYENDGFYLLGLDDNSLTDKTLEHLVSDLDKNRLQILLAHEPQNFEKYAETGVDLVFSGHAHGGQIRIPFVGGLVAPDQGFFPKYTCGIYKYKQTEMLVSRGLGNSILPVRVFNRPEIVILTLRSR